MKKLDVKGIIFDYGGTLDTRGDHWSEVLWKGYLHFGVGVENVGNLKEGATVTKAAFRDAYVYGERALAVNPIITPESHFKDVLRHKIQLQLCFLSGYELVKTGKDDALKQFLIEDPLSLRADECSCLAEKMAEYINGETNKLLAENKLVLEHLKRAGYPMVLVSNFYGNINQVLKDAELDGYFTKVIESAVVGVRKPNPAIFALGVCALDLPASQVLVVGDTYSKDIVPAHALGCHTLWIKGLQWEEKECDETISDGKLRELSDIEQYLLM